MRPSISNIPISPPPRIREGRWARSARRHGASIARCIVVSDSKTGEMDKIDGPYYFFKFIQKLRDAASLDADHRPGGRLNIVPGRFRQARRRIPITSPMSRDRTVKLLPHHRS